MVALQDRVQAAAAQSLNLRVLFNHGKTRIITGKNRLGIKIIIQIFLDPVLLNPIVSLIPCASVVNYKWDDRKDENRTYHTYRQSD